MTRISKSPEQLDAEAAAPRDNRSLADRIETLQEEYRTEGMIERLTALMPPVTRHVVEPSPDHFEVELETEPADGNGRNLSASFVGLIGSIIGRHDRAVCGECQSSSKAYDQETGYGPHHPVRSALTQWDRKCRRMHARWPDHRGRAVCSEIAWSVIRDRTSIEWAAEQAGVSFPRGENLLTLAVDYIEAGVRRASVVPPSIHDRDMCDVCRKADAA